MTSYIDSMRQDNPLHISLFPPHSDSTIEFSFLLNSCLDIFDIRGKQTSIDQDLGLLHAIDERLAAYGWLTTTGVKLLIIVDVFGHEEPAGPGKPAAAAINGLRDSDLKPVCPLSMTSCRTLPLTVHCRPSEHCKVHTFSFCKTLSIPPMTTYRSPETQRHQSQLASPSQTKSLLRTLSASVIYGRRALLYKRTITIKERHSKQLCFVHKEMRNDVLNPFRSRAVYWIKPP